MIQKHRQHRTVAALTGAGVQHQRPAAAIDEAVQLGRQPTTGPPDRMISWLDRFTDTLRLALEQHDARTAPNTFVIMAAQVHPDRRGEGVAAAMLDALRDRGAQRGWPRVVAPVRPTSKLLYPLIPVDTFAAWVREDGLSVDPWIRTHQRMGEKIIGTAPESQTMTGSRTDWETWTGLPLPGAGDFVFPDGLSVLTVDDAGSCRYIEPNVWIEHQQREGLAADLTVVGRLLPGHRHRM